MEVVALKISDIDFEASWVGQGKGRRDRLA
jgi:hypothetical protein